MHKNKHRSSMAFVLGSLGLFGAVYGGWKLYSAITISRFHPKPILPGRVNLVAVMPGAGYRIIVSNGIAHLVELKDIGGFNAPMESDDKIETENAARLPIKDTLGALQGDGAALGTMVMSVNKLSEDDLSPGAPVWTAEDLEKAMDGDGPLAARLASDIHCKLDGTPVDQIRMQVLMAGITINAPVKVAWNSKGKKNELVCRVRVPYKSSFGSAVENRLSSKFDPDKATVLGTYQDEALKRIGPNPATPREDVARSLRDRTSEKRLQGFAEKPARILSNIQVVVNEGQLSGANMATHDGPDGQKLSDLTLVLTEEGRMRLWKYSHQNPGFQLLITLDGVAIGAPKITTELVENQVKLTQLRSPSLVQDAVELINSLAQKGK